MVVDCSDILPATSTADVHAVLGFASAEKVAETVTATEVVEATKRHLEHWWVHGALRHA